MIEDGANSVTDERYKFCDGVSPVVVITVSKDFCFSYAIPYYHTFFSICQHGLEDMIVCNIFVFGRVGDMEVDMFNDTVGANLM